MSRRILFLLLATAFAAILLVGYSRIVSLERRPIDRPIEFAEGEAIKGGKELLKQGATLLIGEVHGTWETPIAVATLARQASAMGHQVIVCVEIPQIQQGPIDRFLASNGDEVAIDNLLNTHFWIGQDGRASVGMFAMLELVRRLRRSGQDVQVKAIDFDYRQAPSENYANYRDQAMAENLLRVRNDCPDAILIALAGNVHTKTVRGAWWDKSYVPMGWHAAQAISGLESFNTQFSGGDAWVHGDTTAGKKAFPGKDLGDAPFLLRDDAHEPGYSGIFYVGRISAAKPIYSINGG